MFLGPDQWAKEDGGTLDFYKTGANGQPEIVEKSIVPTLNTLVIFETTPNIFWQVSDVFSKDKELVLISGYFRAVAKPKPKLFPDPIPKTLARVAVQFKIEEWIDQKYLNQDSLKKFRVHFERHSYVTLTEFFIADKYNSLVAVLKGNQLQWKHLGPPNRRNYYTLGRWGDDVPNLPPEVVQLRLFLHSKAFVDFVEKLTNQRVHSMYQTELRKFDVGSYAFVVDSKEFYRNECIDLHFGVSAGQDATVWPDDDGGDSTYLDGDDELLTVVPANNSVTLMLRDQSITRFVRHVVNTATTSVYDVIKTYVIASKDNDQDSDYHHNAKEEKDADDEEMIEDGQS